LLNDTDLYNVKFFFKNCILCTSSLLRGAIKIAIAYQNSKIQNQRCIIEYITATKSAILLDEITHVSDSACAHLLIYIH